jgi:hypothetical protein
MPRMGEKTVSFVLKAFESATKNANLRPSFLNIEELGVDYSDVISLCMTENNSLQTLEVVNNIIVVADSKSYLTALSFCDCVTV